MARKKTKNNLGFIGLFLLGILFVISGGLYSYSIVSGQSFSIVNEEVFLPQYWTAECIERSQPLTVDIPSHTDTPTFYSCTTSQSGTYIPLVAGVSCNFMPSDFSFVDVYVCDVKYDSQGRVIDGIPKNKEDRRCVSKLGTFEVDSSPRVNVPAGDYVYIDTDKVFGDATLRAEFPSYGLRVRSADGFVNPTTVSCEIQSISGIDYHTLDRGDRVEVLPNVPLNAVSGLQKAFSTQVVSLDRVREGEPIYISRPGFYQIIKEAEDGFKYVHTELGEIRDSSIECIPRTSGCSDDARIVKIVEQSCDKFGGVINNYAPIEGDTSKLCKYDCESGKLKLSNDCIEVRQDSCPADKPVYDAQSGDCVAVLSELPGENNTSYLLALGLLGGGLLLTGLSRRRAFNQPKVGGKQ
jgi:hypothetical protein